MSNMKSTPYLKIVIADGVEHADLVVYGLNNMDEDGGFPVDIDFNGKLAVVVGASEVQPPGTIQDLVDCIQDHMDNTNPNDWLDEVTGDFNTGGDTYVVAQQGTYYGQGIVVHITIIEYA